MHEKKDFTFLIKDLGCEDVDKNGVTLSYLGNMGHIGWINGYWVDYDYIGGDDPDVWLVTAKDKKERDRIVSALESVGKRVVKTGYKKVYFVDYKEGETEEDWLARQRKLLEEKDKFVSLDEI